MYLFKQKWICNGFSMDLKGYYILITQWQIFTLPRQNAFLILSSSMKKKAGFLLCSRLKSSERTSEGTTRHHFNCHGVSEYHIQDSFLRKLSALGCGLSVGFGNQAHLPQPVGLQLFSSLIHQAASLRVYCMSPRFFSLFFSYVLHTLFMISDVSIDIRGQVIQDAEGYVKC